MWEILTKIIENMFSTIVIIFENVKNIFVNSYGKLNIIGMILLIIIAMVVLEIVVNGFISLIKGVGENEK